MCTPPTIQVLYSRIPDRLEIDAAMGLLRDREKDRIESFRFHRDRVRYAYAQLFLRRCLAGHLGCDITDLKIEADDRGKPFLSDAHSKGVGFNLSRCQNWVAVAIGPTTVLGVDVEDNLRVDVLQIARKNLRGLEYDLLASQSAERRGGCFLRMWSCKEAVTKALGYGLALPLDSFSFGNFESPSPTVAFDDQQKFGSSQEWTLGVRQVELDCFVSVAAKLSSSKIVWQECSTNLALNDL